MKPTVKRNRHKQDRRLGNRPFVLMILAFAGVACSSLQQQQVSQSQAPLMRHEIRESEACNKPSAHHPGGVPLMERAKLGETTVFPVFTAASRCFRKGESLPIGRLNLRLQLSEDDAKEYSPDRQGYVFAQIPANAGEVEILNLFSLDQEMLSLPIDELARRLEFEKPAVLADSLEYAKRERQVAPIIIFKARIKAEMTLVYSRARPYIPELMEGVLLPDEGELPYWARGNYPRLRDFLQSGGILIDVRSEAEFKNHHHPAAINVPYFLERPVDIANLFDFLPRRHREKFALEKLPKDQQQQIAFIGKSVIDERASKAQIFARFKGWRNSVHLYGGEESRFGRSHETPSQVSDIEQISLDEARDQHFSGAAILVDTRSRSELRVRTPKNARAVVEFVPKKRQAALLEDRELTDAELNSLYRHVQFAKLTADRSKRLIFSGADIHDHRPLNFARLAKLAGRSNVKWLRKGLGGWLSKGDLHPDRFQTASDGK